jgi:ribose transport system substrate-binding protein
MKMKKRIFVFILVLAMVCAALTGCITKQASISGTNKVSDDTEAKTEESSDGSFTIGMTVNDLTNQIFSSTCENLDGIVKDAGGTLTYLDCGSNASKQIEQIENFVSNGVDAIIIQPAEANAIDSALKQAIDAGIKVFCWDEDIQNADICWLIDNYELGKQIGTEAAKWVNEKNGGNCEVAVLNYPQLEILVERGNGIVDALKENAPNATIVAESSAINATEGMDATETILQGHPKVKVIACIGGGGAIGANEAVKSSGKLADDFGIFAADCTTEEMAAMYNDEACRASVMITGGGKEIAEEIFRLTDKLIKGEETETKIYRETFVVNKDNLNEYYTAQ